MSRKPMHSTQLLAEVRRYYGLSKEALAQYLGISRGMVSHIEAGRRGLSLELSDLLAPLTQQMTDVPQLPAAAPALPGAPAFDPDPLQARRAYCLWKAANLRYDMQPYAAQALCAARWAQALPALLAPLPPADLLHPPDSRTPGGPAAFRQWLSRCWLENQAAEMPPADVAAWHLLRLRADALEGEAAALTALLAAPPPAPS